MRNDATKEKRGGSNNQKQSKGESTRQQSTCTAQNEKVVLKQVVSWFIHQGVVVNIIPKDQSA